MMLAAAAAAATAAPPATKEPAGNSCYLYASYRVGMLALETLGRRIHDERSYVKYTQNPPYGDDVKWLLKVRFAVPDVLKCPIQILWFFSVF